MNSSDILCNDILNSLIQILNQIELTIEKQQVHLDTFNHEKLCTMIEANKIRISHACQLNKDLKGVEQKASLPNIQLYKKEIQKRFRRIQSKTNVNIRKAARLREDSRMQMITIKLGQKRIVHGYLKRQEPNHGYYIDKRIGQQQFTIHK